MFVNLDEYNYPQQWIYYMRMNNFLSEADQVSINICFNQNYR